MNKRTVPLLCVLLLPLFLMAQPTKKPVTMKGTLINFSNQVEVEDLSDLQYLLPPKSDRMIVPDSSGRFSLSFALDAPNYFRIGRNILYLSPGDDLEVTIDKSKPTSGSFSGRGSEANLYLRHTPFPKGGSFLEAGRKTQKTAKATIDTLLQAAKDRQAEWAQLKGVSAEFKRLEAARIKADLLNSLAAGMRSYRPRLSTDSLNAYMEEYKQLMQPLVAQYGKGFLDASLMKLVVYRDVVDDLLKFPGKKQDVQQVRDWMAAYKMVREMKLLSDKDSLKAYKARLAAVSTPRYQKALGQTLDNLLKFGKGDTAVDFVATDLNGNKVALSSLKGKVIYVDLWATWCGPCMAEMPHFEELKKKYEGKEGVAFVSLSIDDGYELWKRSVDSRQADGIQWLINRNLLNDYDIVTIPRSLLIDKDFKMADMNAPMPSSKELVGVLDSLLKKAKLL